ncbi:hypothetical protein ACFQQD_11935 [Citricoccus sp. GCM10030269]
MAAVVLAMAFVAGGCHAPEGPAEGDGRAGVSGDGSSAGKSVSEPDGGVDYYGRFEHGLPTSEEYFPIGLWLSSVTDEGQARHEREAGLNLYVDLTEDSNLDFLDDERQRALTSWSSPDSAGAVLGDEVDMWAGAGSGEWTGNFPGQGPICLDEKRPCGLTVQQQLASGVEPGVMTYANYGKGVTFWFSDHEASRFVSGPQDVVSADNYWFTDPNICAVHEGGTTLPEPRALTASECRLPANYGWTVQRLRNLMEPRGSKPVWAFIEIGQPFQDGTEAPPSVAQIRAAVWSSLVHGARGIVYFGHSFGGPCPTFHVLRDCGSALLEGVSDINAEVTSMAPVLNAPTIEGAVQVEGDVDATVTWHQGSLYILSTAASPEPGGARFRLDCVRDATVNVVGENRRLTVHDGQFTDGFPDETTVHLYEIAADSCEP